MGLFIAIISFHRGTLSISLLANIQTTEKGTNWPTFVEVIIVYLLFEFYRFSTSRSTNNYIQNNSISYLNIIYCGIRSNNKQLFNYFNKYF